MSAQTTERSYSIKEASALTGLPASTLRYYESIGVISPIGRGDSSKHRVYTEGDLDQLTWVACLQATGLSVGEMRQYLRNSARGADAAAEQVELLHAQQKRLAREGELLAVRRRYVQLKIDYWNAVSAGDEPRAELLAAEARSLADQLRPNNRQG